MRYNVQCHFFGKPEITSAAEHRHQQITNEAVAFERARHIADEQPGRAVVVRELENIEEYDNGKEPATPAGWIREVWRRGGAD
jgi:hypothetical protein